MKIKYKLFSLIALNFNYLNSNGSVFGVHSTYKSETNDNNVTEDRREKLGIFYYKENQKN